MAGFFIAAGRIKLNGLSALRDWQIMKPLLQRPDQRPAMMTRRAITSGEIETIHKQW